MKYTFSEFIENKNINEVAEYMTGDDPNITIHDIDGRNYLANHKELGKLLNFQYDYHLNSPKMSATSFTNEKDREDKGYIVTMEKDFDSNQKSKLLGSYIAAVAKFINTYKPGTLNFEHTYEKVNSEMRDIIPLMQKSLKTMAMKNNMFFLNNKMMNKDALENLNRNVKSGKDYAGLDWQKRLQGDVDDKVQSIKDTRQQSMLDKRASIEKTKDFMAQQRGEFDAKRQARADRLAPKPNPQQPTAEPAQKKSWLGRMFGK